MAILTTTAINGHRSSSWRGIDPGRKISLIMVYVILINDERHTRLRAVTISEAFRTGYIHPLFVAGGAAL